MDFRDSSIEERVHRLCSEIPYVCVSHSHCCACWQWLRYAIDSQPPRNTLKTHSHTTRASVSRKLLFPNRLMHFHCSHTHTRTNGTSDDAKCVFFSVLLLQSNWLRAYIIRFIVFGMYSAAAHWFFDLIKFLLHIVQTKCDHFLPRCVPLNDFLTTNKRKLLWRRNTWQFSLLWRFFSFDNFVFSVCVVLVLCLLHFNCGKMVKIQSFLGIPFRLLLHTAHSILILTTQQRHCSPYPLHRSLSSLICLNRFVERNIYMHIARFPSQIAQRMSWHRLRTYVFVCVCEWIESIEYP